MMPAEGLDGETSNWGFRVVRGGCYEGSLIMDWNIAQSRRDGWKVLIAIRRGKSRNAMMCTTTCGFQNGIAAEIYFFQIQWNYTRSDGYPTYQHDLNT